MKTLLWGAGVMLASIAAVPAADHRIDYIERDGRYVNIHFNTLPNRTYTLQYRNSVSFTNAPGTPTTGWSNLFGPYYETVPNSHYVISDVRTNQQQRYYRLRVTP